MNTAPQNRLTAAAASIAAGGGRLAASFDGRPEGFAMLYYAVVFFIIALVAALFGFGGIAAGAASIAKILFFVFVAMAVVAFLFGLTRRR
jgi:uncharacterized membrane protein YtjA (UPF0391 family)